jgi:hypothetical protein
MNPYRDISYPAMTEWIAVSEVRRIVAIFKKKNSITYNNLWTTWAEVLCGWCFGLTSDACPEPVSASKSRQNVLTTCFWAMCPLRMGHVGLGQWTGSPLKENQMLVLKPEF